MMKKIVALLTVLALVLAAGCAGGTGDNTDKTAPSENTSDVTAAEDVNTVQKPQTGFLLFGAQYPERAVYPQDDDGSDGAYDDWFADNESYRMYDPSKAEGLNGFAAAMTRALLENADGENRVCSPLNIYMALAMLAEVTDGDTREELLDALGADDTAALREQARALWDANYTDDGVVKSLLADSVWLNDGMTYKPDALKTLAENYFASVFSGEPGTKEYDDALHGWINEQTGNLLKDSAEGLQMNPLMAITLVSSVYFKGRWTETFDAMNSKTETFHGAEKDEPCEMMRQVDGMGYYRGKGFAAVNKGVMNANGFRFILPDEGVTVDEVLASKDFADYLTYDPADPLEDYTQVALSVPKFDVTADSDVIPTLQGMGVKQVFEHGAADFSPLTDDGSDIAVDKVQHSARVTIDEEGCEAAAFTA
ncbi:MAG: hypothetical protein II184_07735, partial [Clostridia bacterium]|nr:hypothetical protein [Clostridia bacterium]